VARERTDEESWRRRKRGDWGAFTGAAGYEARIGAHAHRVDREVVTRLLGAADRAVLDLPCGAGRMSVELAAERPRTLVSADYSPGMLAVARRNLANPLLRCDAFALPFRDGCFDRVLTLRLVFHYADPLPILAESARVLRAGGELVFDTLNPLSTRHAAEWGLRALSPRRRRAGLRFHSRRQVRELLARAGLEPIAAEGRFLLPTRAYRFLPRAICGALAALERAVPSGRRVLTYWRAGRPG